MAADYFPALRQAVMEAGQPIAQAERLAVYKAARKALRSELSARGISNRAAEKIALDKAVLQIEAEIGHAQRPVRLSRLRIKASHAVRIIIDWAIGAIFIAAFLYPVYAPPAYLPQWTLNHPWVLLVYCVFIALSCIFWLFIFRSLAELAIKKRGKGLQAMRGIISEYPLMIPMYVACLLIPLAGILYNLGNLSRYYNPFDREFAFFDAYLFLADEGLKGMFSELIELFGFTLQDKLKYVKTDHFIFWGVILAYKTTIAFLGLGTLVLIGRWLLVRGLRYLRIALRPAKRAVFKMCDWMFESRKRQMDFIYRISPRAFRPFLEWNAQFEPKYPIYKTKIPSWEETVKLFDEDSLTPQSNNAGNSHLLSAAPPV